MIFNVGIKVSWEVLCCLGDYIGIRITSVRKVRLVATLPPNPVTRVSDMSAGGGVDLIL